MNFKPLSIVLKTKKYDKFRHLVSTHLCFVIFSFFLLLSHLEAGHAHAQSSSIDHLYRNIEIYPAPPPDTIPVYHEENTTPVFEETEPVKAFPHVYRELRRLTREVNSLKSNQTSSSQKHLERVVIHLNNKIMKLEQQVRSLKLGMGTVLLSLGHGFPVARGDHALDGFFDNSLIPTQKTSSTYPNICLDQRRF